MKLICFTAAILAVAVTAPVCAKESHAVRGYTRKDGTYVAPHRATNPDSTRMNNWSTRGNVNPYTGKIGTVDPYKPSAPSTYRPTTPRSPSRGY